MAASVARSRARLSRARSMSRVNGVHATTSERPATTARRDDEPALARARRIERACDAGRQQARHRRRFRWTRITAAPPDACARRWRSGPAARRGRARPAHGPPTRAWPDPASRLLSVHAPSEYVADWGTATRQLGERRRRLAEQRHRVAGRRQSRAVPRIGLTAHQAGHGRARRRRVRHAGLRGQRDDRALGAPRVHAHSTSHSTSVAPTCSASAAAARVPATMRTTTRRLRVACGISRIGAPVGQQATACGSRGGGSGGNVSTTRRARSAATAQAIRPGHNNGGSVPSRMTAPVSSTSAHASARSALSASRSSAQRGHRGAFGWSAGGACASVAATRASARRPASASRARAAAAHAHAPRRPGARRR